MKPDFYHCSECSGNKHPNFEVLFDSEDQHHGCYNPLTKLYSRESLINWIQERKKKTWGYYNDPESKVIPNESMYATLGAFDAVIAELTAGEG